MAPPLTLQHGPGGGPALATGRFGASGDSFVDDDDARARGILDVILVVGVVVSAVYAAVNFFFFGASRPAGVASTLVLAFIAASVALRAGLVRPTAIFVVACCLAAGLAGTWTAGIEGSSPLALAIATVLAGMTLGPRAAVVASLTGIGGFVSILAVAPPIVVPHDVLHQGTGIVLQLAAGGILMVATARSNNALLRRLRVEQGALQQANDNLARRVRDEQALAAIGRLLVEGDDVDAAFGPALQHLYGVWNRPMALFVRGVDRPRARHAFGFRAPVLVGGDEEAARIVAEEDGGVVEVVDGADAHRCRAVPIRTGTVPHGVLVASLGDEYDVDASRKRGDDAVLVGAATLFAAAFEWREAEGRMRLAERRRAALVKASPDGLLILDDAGIIVDANPAATALFGLQDPQNEPLRAEPLLGRSFAGIETVSAEDLKRVARALTDAREQSVVAAGAPGSGDHSLSGVVALTFRRKNGSVAHVEMRVTHASSVVGDAPGVEALLEQGGRFDVSLRDVTGRIEALKTRERLEQQLYAARRLEALGQLAGGVAHDFNNLLSVILTNARLLLEEKEGQRWLDDVAKADLSEIVDCGKRAADLTGQLLTFARQQRREPRVTDLSAVVRGVEKLLRRLTPADVRIELELKPVWMIVADPAQIEQVLVNLIANARDAMPGGGACRVRTRNMTAIAGELPVGLPEAGRWVELSVEDEGTGMDEETKSHVFEPFFTTKPTGKGSGLGLATVYGIVKQSGGHITVESAPGHGTTFRVWLPERDALLENEDHTPAAGGAISLGRERVLVVDDDVAVRRATERALSSRGFVVLSASTMSEALVVSEGGVDAVVADLVMPNVQGDALVEQLREKYPALPAVLLTGYGRRSVDLARPFRMLRKPASPEELARTLRSVIDEGALGKQSLS